MIDIYDTFLPDGKFYKTIYINMYGARKSQKAPNGFALAAPIVQPQVMPKKEQTVKTKYCSCCGSAIENKTKRCTGCGKQYFRGFRFTKFSTTVVVLALIVAIISAFCVSQYIKIQKLEEKLGDKQIEIGDLKDEIDDFEDEVYDLEDEVYDLEYEIRSNNSELNFFRNHAEIVPNDGTRMYHKWGCSELDSSARFWIYNTEAVPSNCKECPYCH